MSRNVISIKLAELRSDSVKSNRICWNT